MSRIYKELPIVFPFYDNINNQNRYRENVANVNQFDLISPNNALLPFQIEMPAAKGNPTGWSLHKLNGDGGYVARQAISLSSNYNKVKVYKFGDRQVATYNGEALTAQYPFVIGLSPLNLSCGHYFTRIIFGDGSSYYSEVFFIPENAFTVGAPNDFIKIDFWCEKDVFPVLYRDNFRQSIYLNTFVHSFEPEIEQEPDKDGFNSEIPVLSKLSLKYKFTDTVPDFVKIALVSLQMQDKVTFTTRYRAGEFDRVQVTVQPHEGGGLSDVDVLFEDEILMKTNCDQNQAATSIGTW